MEGGGTVPQFECEVQEFCGDRHQFTIEANDIRDAEDEVDCRMSRYSSDYNVLYIQEIG
jgi:hypothetical protein